MDRRFILQDEERERFTRLMRAYESFCQVRVVTYCVMSNHFHILVEVKPRPDGQDFSDEWVVQRSLCHLFQVLGPNAASDPGGLAQSR